MMRDTLFFVVSLVWMAALLGALLFMICAD
jgi:hypothetical protein